LETWVLDAQKDIQSVLAGAVRRLRGGQPGALAAFLAVCFAYGFLHAAGPGHGKLVIGSYGVARRIPMAKLSLIALLSSLAQAALAVALVAGGFWVLGWTRDQTAATATQIITPIGTLAITGIGLWLVWRGVKTIVVRPWFERRAEKPGHDHDHVHGPHCNHSHGPQLEEVEALTSSKDAIVLIAGIAMRPCTGALLVLILCFQLGIAVQGVAGAFAIGLGTAVVTITVAMLAVWGREGALSRFSDTHLTRVLPVIELTAGLLLVVVSVGLLFKTT
jgi:nickel/cobalt exporter